ncbi:unnamed protein product [Gulo gulo]|uniref:Uncharacterized protein n=1 Tax=Gulo gulo TaxID=48420 RepID=A0A9X9M194_GULGU|nr:unnamed protein product [Gulo gulo]
MSIRAPSQTTGSSRSYRSASACWAAQLAYSKQFSDMERTVSSSSGVYIVCS